VNGREAAFNAEYYGGGGEEWGEEEEWEEEGEEGWYEYAASWHQENKAEEHGLESGVLYQSLPEESDDLSELAMVPVKGAPTCFSHAGCRRKMRQIKSRPSSGGPTIGQSLVKLFHSTPVNVIKEGISIFKCAVEIVRPPFVPNCGSV
jgi:hypothetical protein